MAVGVKVGILKPEAVDKCVRSYFTKKLYKVCITGDGRYIIYDAILDEVDVERVQRFFDRVSRGEFPGEKLDPRIKHIVDRHVNGYGLLEGLLMDDDVVDVFAISGVPISIVHKEYGRLETNIVLEEEDLIEIILRASNLAGKGVSERRPIPSFIEPRYNSRFSVVYRSDINARGYVALDIRKQPPNPWSIFRLIDLNTISLDMASFLWLMVKYKVPIMVVGELFTGKTTTINSLLSLIPPDSRVFTIEDAPELVAPTRYWIRTITREDVDNPQDRIGVFQLIKIAVRMSVDYVIVGEVRGEEAREWAQAILLGHGGLTSFHSATVEAALLRLKSPPIEVPDQALRYLNVFVKMEPLETEEGRLRRIAKIYLYDEGRTHLAYTYDPAKGEFGRVINPLNLPFIDRVAKGHGLKTEDLKVELEAMREVLARTMEELVENYGDTGRIPFREVPQIIYSRLDRALKGGGF
ncbi:MAG: type II/IV secretion system ATPase subunit [Thermoprotei archaeon]|nr:type II/IV secretion system ATPase subunit [Thermoprotei archaeon]